jgi:hypothetical protein
MILSLLGVKAVSMRSFIDTTEPHNWRAHRTRVLAVGRIVCTAAAVAVGSSVVAAQSNPQSGSQSAPQSGGWQTGIDRALDKALSVPQLAPPPAAAAPAIPVGQGQIRLKALLTDDQTIDQGVVWRVFAERTGGLPLAGTAPDGDGRARLVATQREASPLLRLPVGDYIVNVGFGRASLTRRMTVKPGDNGLEKFVLNAGGLRLIAYVGNGETPAANTVTYDIYSDERDQFGQRAKVLAAVKPSLIIRLNSGIYHLVSTYGDANATVQLDVTVEPGKLTEATIAHAAGKATFKLVTRTGGEAVTDTQWVISTPQGEPVKESVGALPTHTLSPGRYVVTAKQGGKAYRRDFTVQHGGMTQVEVMRQ